MPKHANQYTVLPDELLKPHLQYAYELGLNDKQILEYVKGKFDKDQYTLSLKTIRRQRQKWGLDSSRITKKKITPEQLTGAIMDIRERFPKMGSRDMRFRMRAEYGWWVPRNMLLEWFQIHEPHLVQERKMKRFRRKRFYAAGVNHIWAIDQHDKWRWFGLFMHLCVEPYSGRIMWLKIWWTNSNPRLIGGWYLATVREVGAVPLLTQSDPGSENYGVANAHTAIRHRLDPKLCGTSQHKFKRKHQNIKPEIEWRKLRHRWTPGFEDMLDNAVNNGWFDLEDDLQAMIFRWVAIPYLQKELDVYTAIHNNSNRRHDPHKVLPAGIPNLIYHEPEKYGGSLDFCVPVNEIVVAEVKERWAPRQHEVFELVHPQLDRIITHLWVITGRAVINTNSLWNVFELLLTAFRAAEPEPQLDLGWHGGREAGYDGGGNDQIELTPNLEVVELHAGIRGVPLRGITITYHDVDPNTHGRSAVQAVSGQEGDSGSEGSEDERIFVTFSDESQDEEITDESDEGDAAEGNIEMMG